MITLRAILISLVSFFAKLMQKQGKNAKLLAMVACCVVLENVSLCPQSLPREGKMSPFPSTTLLHLPGLASLPSLDSLNIPSSICNQINPPQGQPWKAQKLLLRVHGSPQRTLFNHSYFRLRGWGWGSTTLEQIPIVSFTFTSPASTSFPTGSNILLAMFNSYFTWGIESTK